MWKSAGISAFPGSCRWGPKHFLKHVHQHKHLSMPDNMSTLLSDLWLFILVWLTLEDRACPHLSAPVLFKVPQWNYKERLLGYASLQRLANSYSSSNRVSRPCCDFTWGMKQKPFSYDFQQTLSVCFIISSPSSWHEVLIYSLISPLVLEAYSQILNLCFSIHKDEDNHKDGNQSQEGVWRSCASYLPYTSLP